MTPKITWTSKEDAIIRRKYPSYGAQTCQIFIRDKTTTAISRRAASLGVQRNKDNGNTWSGQENDVIIKYYPAIGAVGCREKLPKRTAAACQKRSQILGIKMNKKDMIKVTHQPRPKQVAVNLHQVAVSLRENSVSYIAMCRAWT